MWNLILIGHLMLRGTIQIYSPVSSYLNFQILLYLALFLMNNNDCFCAEL